ncbi:SDR family oxidoreductase [Frankia gtarii]|uniref:SDR family oxidoreductase n=1 Tax=Frankia gtarii TaxID=2950102 RepID=UPI0021C196ED|nr:SDR family oxidoreductase [Frankia gtarii]
MSQSESSRNVVVVIGTGGMGVAAARRLASGRRLVLADNSPERLESVVAVLQSEGHAVAGHPVDVTDRKSVEDLANAAGSGGRIEAVVHTAGVSPVMGTARQIYEVDLLGTAHVIDAFLAVVSPGTSLICIASMGGQLTSLPADFERHLATAPSDQLLLHEGIDLDKADSATAYAVAKRGNQLRVQGAAQTWGRKGARLNTISPGVISTPMSLLELQGPTGVFIQSMIDASGAGRLGTPDDVAGVVAFLAGPDSSFITGNDILVDGGTISALRWNAEAKA